MRSYYIFFELILLSIIIKDSVTKYLLVEVEEEDNGGGLSSKKEGESCGLGGAHSGLPPLDHPPIGWGAMGRSLGEVFGICGPDLTCEPSKDEDKPGTCIKKATIEGKESIQQPPQRLAGNLGIPPPKYLKVEGHKDCMGTKDMGSWQAICLHLIQPEKCKDDAWTQLKGLTKTDEVLQCEEEAKVRGFNNVIEDLTKCSKEGEFCLGYGTNIKPCCDGLECTGFPIKKCEVPQVTEPELCKSRPNVCMNPVFAPRCPITCA